MNNTELIDREGCKYFAMGYRDEDLIVDFQAGLRRAFDELYRRYYEQIFYTSVKYIGDREHSKDITIITLNKLFRKFKDFDNLPEVGGFLFRTCRNLCFDHLRYLKRLTASRNNLITALENDPSLADMSSDNDQLTAEYLSALKKSIEALPERQRIAIELLFLEELKFREVAEQMNISVAAVIKLRKKGLMMLQQMLQPRRSIEIMVLVFLSSYFAGRFFLPPGCVFLIFEKI